MSTLLLDLLTEEEDQVDNTTREFRFDIPLLAKRTINTIDYLQALPTTRGRLIGTFGASTGGAGSFLFLIIQRIDDIG